MKRARRLVDSGSDREDGDLQDENFSSGSPSSQGSLHGEKNAAVNASAENAGLENISALPVPVVGSTDENPASEGDEPDISSLMDDMIVRNEPESRRRENESEENSHRSGSPTGSLCDVMQGPAQFFDENFPTYLRTAVLNVSPNLRNLGTIKYDIPKNIYKDKRGVISVLPRHEQTMDSAGKCFQLVTRKDPSKFMQPFEAASWNFVSQ